MRNEGNVIGARVRELGRGLEEALLRLALGESSKTSWEKPDFYVDDTVVF